MVSGHFEEFLLALDFSAATHSPAWVFPNSGGADERVNEWSFAEMGDEGTESFL